MTDTDRPEVDDPRVLALAQARQQMAHENQFNAGFCPPWDGLTEQEQRLSLLDARNYLRAALKAGLLAAPVVVPSAPVDRAELRDRIRRVLCDRDGQGSLWGTDMLEPDEYGADADAVLAVLPAPADRAAILREAADAAAEKHRRNPWTTAADVIADVRRMADEARQPEMQAENPARIDRLRPEFTDHASVESIDAQLRRARSQLRRWHLRVEWLISLRQARVEQKERGEWPAAVSQPGKEA